MNNITQSPSKSPASSHKMEACPANPDWFLAARFGMFVHWGLYSLAARHEWVKNHEEMSDGSYQVYFDHFNPDRYDPRKWAKAAKSAGMKYVVLTAKHHDGFCLWDSNLTEYKVTNTPYGKDLLAEYVDACRAEGLRVGIYYSLIDWHHKSFPVDGTHPQRNDSAFKAENSGRDIAEYREYLHGQVRELLTDFGPIDYLFFDFSYSLRTEWWGGKGPDDWGSPQLLSMIKSLQPNILVNDRLGIPGDFITPEQYQPSAPMMVEGRPVVWEACQTLNGSWGYDRDNQDYKSVGTILRLLIDGVAKGGNLLLNVGPTARGSLDPVATTTLSGIAHWMDDHSRSIHNCGPAEYLPPADSRFTQSGNRLYLHLFDWPYRFVHLPGLGKKVAYAQLMHDASEIRRIDIDPNRPATNTQMGGQPEGTLTLELPVQRPDTPVPVIELFLSDPSAKPSPQETR